MKNAALISVVFVLCHWLAGGEVCATAQSKQHFPTVSIYSNLAYDAALVPNLGVQVGLPKGWTVSAAWNGSWWSGEGHSWKIYGPEITARWYFSGLISSHSGGAISRESDSTFGHCSSRGSSHANLFTGHHVGLYLQALTYDVQLKGHTGYLGGEPGGNLFDRAHWGVGVEYGYTFRLTKQLDLDLSIGLGYLGGKYYTYEYVGGQYVWQATAHRNYFGPTRLGVTLYWNIPL